VALKTQKRNQVELFYMSARAIHAGANVIAIALAPLVFTLCVGCGTHSRAHVPRAPSPPARIGQTETGIASWYGNPYNGRQTASGEIFDMEQLTAAHRTLSFNTWLEVTNLSNGKQVDVRITDRGPFIKGRIIDLSLRAAREIDMIRAGIVQVRIRVIAAPVAPPPVVTPPVNDVGQVPELPETR
jgi:rare lipoprotein A